MGVTTAHFIEVRIAGPSGDVASHWHPTPGGAMQCARHLRNALGEQWRVTTLPRAEPMAADARRVSVPRSR